MHTTQWTLRLHLFEDDDRTTRARATLDTGTTVLTGRGTAHRAPGDGPVPEIGDELAAGRALQDLASHLLRTAERDIQAVGATAPKIVHVTS